MVFILLRSVFRIFIFTRWWHLDFLHRSWCLEIFLFLSQVVGVEGIMSAYSSTLYSVSLAGPTLFGPVISKAAEIASHSVQYGNNKYFVLLIITVCNHIYPTGICHVTSVQKFYLSIVCRMELSLTSKKQKILL